MSGQRSPFSIFRAMKIACALMDAPRGESQYKLHARARYSINPRESPRFSAALTASSEMDLGQPSKNSSRI